MFVGCEIVETSRGRSDVDHSSMRKQLSLKWETAFRGAEAIRSDRCHCWAKKALPGASIMDTWQLIFAEIMGYLQLMI